MQKQTTVTIAEHDIIKITLEEADVRSHFHNQRIYESCFQFKSMSPLSDDYYIFS
jgi:hypothetical protein